MDFVSPDFPLKSHDTSGVNLCNSRLLAQHPAVQHRLRTECLALSSYTAGVLPTKDELKNMKHLANVIREGQYRIKHINETASSRPPSTPSLPLSTYQYASSHKDHRSPRRRRPGRIISSLRPQRRSSLIQCLRHAPSQRPLRRRRR